MPIPDDVDVDALIARLAGPLSPQDRDAFRRAGEAALAAAPCLGPGLAYRILAGLQHTYFHPPSDKRASWDIGDNAQVTKLRARPALEHGRDLRFTRKHRLAG